MENQVDGSFFSLSADEVLDVSNWEQLCIIVRYVSDKNLLTLFCLGMDHLVHPYSTFVKISWEGC